MIHFSYNQTLTKDEKCGKKVALHDRGVLAIRWDFFYMVRVLSKRERESYYMIEECDFKFQKGERAPTNVKAL